MFKWMKMMKQATNDYHLLTLAEIKQNQDDDSDNLLFLDFDGVFFIMHETPGEVMGRINKLCERYAFHIVVSSSWRGNWDVALKALEDAHCKAVIDGATELSSKSRPQQILTYLNEHHYRNFLILDDAYLPGLEDHHIKTDMNDGFTEKRYQQAIKTYDQLLSHKII